MAQEDTVLARFDLELIPCPETKPPTNSRRQSQPTVIVNSYEHLVLSWGDKSVRISSKRLARVSRQGVRTLHLLLAAITERL